MNYILRRRRLGRTSTREIRNNMVNAVSVVRNDRAEVPADANLVFRWGCTSNVPTNNVVNTAEAIHQVNNKLEFRMFLQKLMPDNVPHTFSIFDWVYGGYQKSIVRPHKHAQGKNLLVIGGEQDVIRLRSFIAQHPQYYISSFFDKVAEYRVFCIQGRVACVARKYPGDENAVAWNVAQGGRFENVRWGDWNLKAVRIALEAFNASKLDFGGVDVMVDANNNVKVIEINSAPSLTSPYRQQCFAKCFDYIVENGKERIPLIQEKGDWKKFIHPALNDRALIP